MDTIRETPDTAPGRIVAICTVNGCVWVRMLKRDGTWWEGDLPRELPEDKQEAAGACCPAHLPTIEAVCACRRRRVDGRWETAPLPRDIPIAKTVPVETCPVCSCQ